jgi:outer membrane phospholipase A
MIFINTRKISLLFALLSFLLVPTHSHAESTLTDCLNREMDGADNTVTLGEVRERCNFEQNLLPLAEDKPPSSGKSNVDERLKFESAVATNPWVITPHRPNYLLPLTYNSSVNNLPFVSQNEQFKSTEASFQISFKFPIIRNLFSKRAHVYFAYTNQSYWQVFSDSNSSPFRETSHEPEIFLLLRNDWELFGWRNSVLTFG